MRVIAMGADGSSNKPEGVLQTHTSAETHAPEQDPTTLCAVCQQQQKKYTCPGCYAQTCSLACSKQHKQQTGCSGQRDKFAFVPMQQFSDKHLMSDYHWLEEVSRADSNARRLRPPTPRKELPQHLSQLVHQAKYRGVRLLIMPPGMQKRQQNSTRYDFRARKMHWRIEWRFPAAAAAAAAAEPQAAAAADCAPATAGSSQPQPLVITDGRVDEQSVISEVLAQRLEYQLGAGQQALLLREYRQAGLEKLTLLMRKERCPANAVRYYQIDSQQTLRSQLAGKILIEYPMFIVLLPGHETAYDIISSEEQQAEQQAGFSRHGGGFRQQQQQQLLLPPPPPPRLAASAPGSQQQQQQQSEQQQEQEDDDAGGAEPAAKRQCFERAPRAAAAAAGVNGGVAELAAAVSVPDQAEQQHQHQHAPDAAGLQQQPRSIADGQQQQQSGEQHHQQQQEEEQQRQPKYYYYDPTAGADEDAAELLAGLDSDSDEHQQQQQQQLDVDPQHHQQQQQDEQDGQATMMALLGQYDENEIDIE